MIRPIRFARFVALTSLFALAVASVVPYQAARAYGLLPESAKSAIVASDTAPAPTCYDINQSNCSATKSDGTLTACGAAYSGPCTGSCTGSCSVTNNSTWTSQVGTTVGASPPWNQASSLTCGTVKMNGICTAIPNPGLNRPDVIAGAGCYCVSGTVGTAACGLVNSSINTDDGDVPACSLTVTPVGP